MGQPVSGPARQVHRCMESRRPNYTYYLYGQSTTSQQNTSLSGEKIVFLGLYPPPVLVSRPVYCFTHARTTVKPFCQCSRGNVYERSLHIEFRLTQDGSNIAVRDKDHKFKFGNS